MPPRDDARRNDLKERLAAAAEAAASAEGIAGFNARALASATGISVGTLYNLVGGVDELILLVASRTLAILDAELEAAQRGVGDPAGRLVAIAVAYLRFASSNRGRWQALFEHRMASGEPTPDWAVREQLRLFRHIVGPLAEIAPYLSPEERAMRARTLFSAVHGVVWLGLDRRMIAVPTEALEAELDAFVRAAAAGMNRSN